ncbi:DNA recombination protein RmuC [Geofilum rubicundum JCM 15548]|uniref:DNA recombination protein RmuC n=1 Tax=Geofilum rubicundum JCM 15548 TaxID=1236989 RepID=A0A0E9M0P8_9BACT|nr:DNA recombination protein RmuC [Geofilum rubicundum JCM 15548]
MEILSLILIMVLLMLQLFLLSQAQNSHPDRMAQAIRDILQQELKSNREELSTALRDNRTELSLGLDRMTQRLEEKLSTIHETSIKDARANRDELSKSMAYFQEAFSRNITSFNDLQKQKFQEMALRQDEMLKSTESKLDKMRETVDEKLHKTLEDRLGQSFKLVSERLEAVQKGLGEMQSLANGVGDLKKVLSNVKTRGALGEIQLGNILEQIMAPEQYATNLSTKKGSADLVEFAIKLPGREDSGETVYLPIDAKFPQEDYLRLQAAFETGEKALVETETKKLVQAIKKSARDIRDKYIDPPHTTDFGILFLPVEGLYAEVVRQPGLLMLLQRDYKIIVTGPTTLAAMLNSLQMASKPSPSKSAAVKSGKSWAPLKQNFQNSGKSWPRHEKKSGKQIKSWILWSVPEPK